MQDTCTNCQNIKNSLILKNGIKYPHNANFIFAENKRCVEKNNYNACSKNVNSKNKKLFTIMVSLWFFAFMLLVPTVLLGGEQKIDKTSAASSLNAWYYILAIDLNLDDLGLDIATKEQMISQFTDIICETKYVVSGVYTGHNDDIDVNNDGTTPIDAKISRFTIDDYSKESHKNTNFSDYTLKLSICNFRAFYNTAVTVKYNSIDLTNLYNKINEVYNNLGEEKNMSFKGFKLQFPIDASATISLDNDFCTFSSTENLFDFSSYAITGGGDTYYLGFLLCAEWGEPVTNADVNINISVQGVNNSGVVLYLMKDGVMLSQVAQATNGNIVLKDLAIGDTYELLISKPYMWTISASGSGTLLGCKYTYTVQDPTTDASINTIAFTFSGGATTNSVIII